MVDQEKVEMVRKVVDAGASDIFPQDTQASKSVERRKQDIEAQGKKRKSDESGATKKKAKQVEESEEEEESASCGKCDHEVTEGDEGVNCETSCGKWFHRECIGLTKAAYIALGNTPNTAWACDECYEKLTAVPA
eukprot:m.340328 g.340328  ORF g.340328 m.340328 type:complete len:135 (-) comp19240_c0_seq1:205-609(-)